MSMLNTLRCAALATSSIAAIFISTAVQAAVDNTWQAGEISGAWTNAAHWSLGAIGEGHTARFDLKTTPIEVTFPSGAYTNAAEIFLRGYNTRFDITLNGTNTQYVMGGAADGETQVHTIRPFFPTFGNYSFNFFTYSSPLSAAPLAFSNFKLRYASTDEELLLDFDGGEYNFYDPCGTPITNSSLHFFTMTLPEFSSNRTVRFTDATARAGSMNVSCGERNITTSNLLHLENSDVTLASTLFFPLSSDGSDGWTNSTVSEIRLDSSSLTTGGFGFYGTMKNGVCTNKTFILTLDNESTLTQTGFDFYTQNAHYIINILNGSSMTLNRSVYFGHSGVGTTDVNVVNTTWESQGATMYMGPPAAASSSYPTMRGNLNLSNSFFTVVGNMKFSSAGFSIVDSVVEGFNLQMTDPDIATAELHVNGGVYRLTRTDKNFVSDNGSDLFHGWDTATIGPRGFIIENSYVDCAVSQDFSDAPEGAGTLTVTGSKTFTLSSTNTTVSTLAIAGADIRFADNARYASTLVVTNAGSVTNVPSRGLRGLVLGDAATTGRFTIDAATNVVVDGAISFVNPVFTYVNAPTAATAATLFTADSADAETIALWENLGAAFELPDGYGAFYDVVEKDGKLLFTITVRESATYTETLDEGTRTVSTNCTVSPIDFIRAETAAGAELSFTGELGRGRFEKHGEGTAVLSNPGNEFVNGFGLYAGTLAVTSAGALGYIGNGAVSTIAGGRLLLDIDDPSDMIENPIEIATTESATTPVVVEVTGDATMAAWTATSGSVIKTGPGRLSLAADLPAEIAASDGNIAVRGTTLQAASPIAFTEHGTYSSGSYAGLTVLEGELRLTGEATINATHTFAVGGPLADLERDGGQVGLVVDGTTVDTRNSPGGLAFATAMVLGETVPESMNSPYLYVTNGANLICHNFFGLSDANGTEETPLEPAVVIDGSTLKTMSVFAPNKSADPITVTPVWTVRNGSRLYAGGNMEIYGRDNFRFDGSEFAKNDNGEAAKITVCHMVPGTSNDFSFVNGSVLRCHTIAANRVTDVPFVLTFDDSEWDPGSDVFTFEPTNHSLRVISKGDGLVLAPAAGGAYTWRLDISGSGGLVKRGEGSLAISATNMFYSGVTRVESGTLDLDGSSPSNMAFAGPGTLANGTLVRPVFAIGSEDGGLLATPNLASSAAVSGPAKVDLGRTAADAGQSPLPTEAFTVATYEGAAPDVSSWRLRGTGLRGVRGVFSAADGKVTCTVEPAGVVLTVR